MLSRCNVVTLSLSKGAQQKLFDRGGPFRLASSNVVTARRTVLVSSNVVTARRTVLSLSKGFQRQKSFCGAPFDKLRVTKITTCFVLHR